MDEPTVVVGVVTRAHGVRGEVAVENRSDNPDRWTVGAVLTTPEGRVLTVEAVRPHGRRLLVTFTGVADRTAAEALRGVELSVPRSALPPLAEGEWWPHQIEGCRVTTETGRDLGVVTEVVFNPANDLWVAVDEAGRETLVPALKDLLVGVDVGAKQIVVRDVPGLTAPEELQGS
ncbi:MAG: ribosome maturation factor RimM [Planctomycetaceae bacterium]